MIVKPNETSLRNQNVKVFFENSKNFASTLKSHMLKNTEWGAIAYLSHSAYGIGREVNINNNSEYKTGYSATSNADQSSSYGVSGTDVKLTKPWNTLTGYLASTTGNITGIYDMNGGAFEYVAAYRKNSGTSDKSGFNQEEESAQVNLGYLDEYPTDSGRTLYNKRILGDATGETGPFYAYYDKDSGNQIHNSWYGDGSYMVDSSPWFRRGGIYYDGLLGGQFNFSRTTGTADNGHSFRLALAITN